MSSSFGADTTVYAAKANPDRDHRVSRASLYPHYMWFIIASFIGAIAFCRLISFIVSKISRGRPSHNVVTDLEKDNSRNTNRNLRVSRLPQALINLYRIVAFRLTVTIGSFAVNIAEIVVCVLYIVALFTLLLINDTNVKGVPFDISYWSNRAGALLASQFSLITVLGTKNNVISFITGIGYEKLNIVHRMLARSLFVLLCVHAGGRIYAGLEEFNETWLHTGIMAALAFCILFVISLRPIRGKAYELFFYTHMALALIILGGAYYHTSEFVDGLSGTGKYGHYIWPCFLIWGLDRLIRAIRLVAFNYSYFGFSSGSGTLDASTELLTPHLVRVTLKRPPHFHWAPGQFANLITPTVSLLPFEGHPFTIASYDSDTNTKEVTLTSGSSTTKAYWKELVFLINVRDGFTKRLGQVAAQKGMIKVFLDGPYGQRNDLTGYDNVVLIAGGTGVTYTLPMLLDIVESVRSGKRSCKRVVFIWTVRDSRHFQWVLDVINSAVKLAPSGLQVEIRLFVTGASTTDWDTVSTDSSKMESPAIGSSSSGENSPTVKSPMEILGLQMIFGRPAIDKILTDEAEEARGGSMCVAVCGSQSIATSVRRALRFPVAGPTSVMRGGASITLLVESFGYA